MARHRNVRNMKLADEFEDDDCFGNSVEDDYCISPATAAQFTYNRDKKSDLYSFMHEDDIPEEEAKSDSDHEPLNDSSGFTRPKLGDLETAQLNSCLEELRNIIGDSQPEHILIETVLRHQFSIDKAINELLNQQDVPKPQRQPRENRRSRTQGVTTTQPDAKQPDHVCKVSADSVSQAAINLAQVTVVSSKQPVRGFEPMNASPEKAKSPDKTPDKEFPPVVKPSGNGDAGATLGGLAKETTLTIPKKESIDKGATPKKSKHDRSALKKEYEKRQEGKVQINMVVIGHVDAGKSTLMGHLLYQLGAVNKRLMHKYEQEARKMGKGSFAFAWVLDETEEERSRGVTMDVAQTRFETPSKIITLLDAPGHKDFIPNMITGAAQADVSILVVNATKGEFETGFESGGQTREHALLARSLGVSQIIVAVNKMDTMNWEQGRYDDIVKKMGQFLKQAGFKDSDVSFIPCSGLNGENLTSTIKEPRLLGWYKGATLVEQIDKFKCVDRPIDKPFRLCVGDIFKGMGSGVSVSGRVSAGSAMNGDKILVLPAGESASIKGISIDDEPTNYAFAGDHINLILTGIDMMNVNLGSFLCDPINPIQSATRIRAKIVIFNIELPLTRGYPVVFHYQSISEPAVIRRLVSQLNRSTGEVLKRKPKCLTKNSSAVVELILERPVCVELYKEFKDLGRFMLRNGGTTVAAGLVEEILPFKQSKDDH